MASMAMLNNQMVYSFGHHPNSIMKGSRDYWALDPGNFGNPRKTGCRQWKET